MKHTINFTAIVLAAFVQSVFAISFEPVTIPTIKGTNAEILDYNNNLNLIVTNDTINHCIRFYKLDAGDPNTAFTVKPMEKFIQTPNEPTSVAVCQKTNLGFAAILEHDETKNGHIMAFDLNESSNKPLTMLTAGIWPDCVVVSPNGKWLLAANEAQDNPTTPGSVSYADISTAKADNISDTKLSFVDGINDLTKIPAGQLEPEFIAFDPQSRFAAVTCQENDLVIIIDLKNQTPHPAGIIKLPECSEPDGLDVIDDITLPNGNTGCLIGIAEEGRKNKAKIRKGQTISFYYCDPNDLSTELACRLDVRKPLGLALTTRCDPEGIVLKKVFGKTLAFIGIERQNCVLCLDVTNASTPKLMGKIPTGSRPEGIKVIQNKKNYFLIVANESIGADGSLTICRIIH